MHDLVPMTALGASQPRSDTIGPVTITESPDWALVSVAARLGQEANCQTALEKMLGAKLPRIAGYVSAETLAAFWIGPHVWMLEASYATRPNLAVQIKSACADTASVTDQTGAWVRFDLTGESLSRVMERLCNLDMGKLQPGHARRTLIEHLSCFVIRHADSITLYGPRSAAQSLHHTLITAAKSVF
ncbi:MAG: sarcosine oxidase subunit gamma [Rhodobacteraceae bacterium]|nr:MAG: sarcosine oxidase subunit gamma [Paracoccaceae bacterium]